ncbi:MAG: DUF167 domain-containing protein [Chthonomonadales bacterium]
MSARLDVRLTPRSGRNEIRALEASTLSVRVTSPPVVGEANAALLELLFDVTSVPKSSLRIVSGQSSRTKRVEWTTLDMEEVTVRINQKLGGK